MLRNVTYWQQISSKLDRFSKNKGKILSYLSSFVLPFTIVLSPTIAAGETLGVVKSQVHQRLWAEINSRLQQVGIDYCTIDTANWQEELDLGNISVLLLPNIEYISAVQAQAIEQWMNKGGKVIVTGPTGNLSQPEVISQLRSLFGAYWGFPLSYPTTLQLSRNAPVEWMGRPQLSERFNGGVVIPFDGRGQTAATWLAADNSPAAIVTSNTTVLGWRWGYDTVVSAAFDVAWLQASLNRYGISTYGRFTPVANRQPTACRQSIDPEIEPRPFVPDWQPLPQSRLNSPRQTAITPQEIARMNQELDGLIARFESALLTADAKENAINSSTSKLVEQQFSSQQVKSNKLLTDVKLANNFSSKYKTSHEALQEARNSLKKFQQLSQNRQYLQAKNEWLKGKRTLWDNYPQDRQLAHPEIRAVWLDRGTIVKARSEADLVRIFDRLANAGINTVFFETLNAGYTIYPSHIAPQQNPLVRGWDPLEVAVKLAHARGMELHAWVWTFATGNQRHNIIIDRPKDYLGPVLSRYPDWAITDREGNKVHYSSGKVFLDPSNPGVKRYLSLLLEEIATRYQVDGIHLDYIRYPFQSPDGTKTYGYGLASRQQFKQMTGVDPTTLTPSSPLWSQWMGFRIRQIDNFVASVSQNLKQKRPELILSTAVFPMERQERLTKIQQHWEEWVRQDWIDMLVPMTYATHTEGLHQLTYPLLSKSSEGNVLLLPGIRLLNLPDIIALDQMQLLRGMPTAGYALFAMENINSNLEKIFSQTQGKTNFNLKEPLPHRQPFQTTALRYQNLQKEWNFLLSEDRWLMEEITMKSWAKKTDELALALQQLADEPSQKNLLSAQLSLSSFRRQFPKWMEQKQNISPYQIEVWKNRLDTLDRLLSYGEKNILDRSDNLSAR
ncbi:MAG: family 10 glycosylhydrolase [Xenococcaceae cyanobacterium]